MWLEWYHFSFRSIVDITTNHKKLHYVNNCERKNIVENIDSKLIVFQISKARDKFFTILPKVTVVILTLFSHKSLKPFLLCSITNTSTFVKNVSVPTLIVFKLYFADQILASRAGDWLWYWEFIKAQKCFPSIQWSCLLVA